MAEITTALPGHTRLTLTLDQGSKMARHDRSPATSAKAFSSPTPAVRDRVPNGPVSGSLGTGSIPLSPTTKRPVSRFSPSTGPGRSPVPPTQVSDELSDNALDGKDAIHHRCAVVDDRSEPLAVGGLVTVDPPGVPRRGGDLVGTAGTRSCDGVRPASIGRVSSPAGRDALEATTDVGRVQGSADISGEHEVVVDRAAAGATTRQRLSIPVDLWRVDATLGDAAVQRGRAHVPSPDRRRLEYATPLSRPWPCRCAAAG